MVIEPGKLTYNVTTQLDQDPDLSASVFLEKGCGCKRNKDKPCYSLFSHESMRMQRRELSRDELDLVVFGQIAALLTHTSDTIAPKPLPRQCSSMAYYHGVQICRKTFQKLHGIGITV